tara:strand:- start:46 stop:285 length:240 start_codon:yes stop_codon:yes gene_type:complete
MVKKMDIKSLLIGFLLATSVILFMGHTASNLLEMGRYQVSTTAVGTSKFGQTIFETIIDTKTGSIVSRIKLFDSAFSKK